MIRFAKMAIFPGVQGVFFIRKAVTRGGFQLLNYVRFVSSVCTLYLRVVGAGELTHGGNFQKILDNSFQVVAVGWVQPEIRRIPICE